MVLVLFLIASHWPAWHCLSLPTQRGVLMVLFKIYTIFEWNIVVSSHLLASLSRNSIRLDYSSEIALRRWRLARKKKRMFAICISSTDFNCKDIVPTWKPEFNKVKTTSLVFKYFWSSCAFSSNTPGRKTSNCSGCRMLSSGFDFQTAGISIASVFMEQKVIGKGASCTAHVSLLNLAKSIKKSITSNYCSSRKRLWRVLVSEGLSSNIAEVIIKDCSTSCPTNCCH